MDEMKIQSNLVWKKYIGQRIWYVDLRDTELNCVALGETDNVTIHILAFLIYYIDNPFKISLANL